jgi:uncharacterized pyridoxamine 5'-phosphate oxidase family protein
MHRLCSADGGFVVCELLVENDVELFWSILSSYPVTEEVYKNCDKPPFVYAIFELAFRHRNFLLNFSTPCI